MDAVSEVTLVVDGCPSINNTVPADFYVRLDYCGLHDDGVGGYGCIFRKNSERMDCGDIHQRFSVRYHFVGCTSIRWPG